MRSGEVVGSSGPAASGAARESVLVGARRGGASGCPRGGASAVARLPRRWPTAATSRARGDVMHGQSFCAHRSATRPSKASQPPLCAAAGSV